MDYIFKIIGATGMILITIGIVSKNSLRRNILFTLGGALLLAYSISLHDPVFIPLQTIFTAASLYEIYKIKKR